VHTWPSVPTWRPGGLETYWVERPGANVSVADEFRKQAEEAKQMASHCYKAENEALWLRLAENWLKLAQEADKEADRR